MLHVLMPIESKNLIFNDWIGCVNLLAVRFKINNAEKFKFGILNINQTDMLLVTFNVG